MATLVNISIKGYTEAGHEAAFDFSANGDNVQAEMIDAMNQLWLAGVTPNLPGWVQRHDFEVCDTVLLREQENADGSRTPIVTMYTVKPYLNHKFLHEYLNSAADIAAFEGMIGRSLDKLPLYTGTTSPERGKRQMDTQYFVKVNRFGVLKRIPEAGEGDDAREKHRLVRFVPIVTETPAPSPTGDTSSQSSAKPTPIVRAAIQPTAVTQAANALNEPPTGETEFQKFMSQPAVNPYNGRPAATQPELAGVEGTRSAEEVTKLCGEFYTWLGANHKNLTRDDAHAILEVSSAKDYFATHSLGDAKTQVLAYQKGLANLKKASA